MRRGLKEEFIIKSCPCETKIPCILIQLTGPYASYAYVMDTFAGVTQVMQYGVGQWLRCVEVGSQKEEG
jgi:hypothetical protein